MTIWRYCSEFLFLCRRLCHPNSMFCHVLGINVGGLCLLGLSRLASLLLGLVGFAPWTLLLYSFIYLFIPPPGFRFPLVVLVETAEFGGSIQTSRGSFSIDQTASMWFAISSATPEAVSAAAAAAITFNLRADWNWLEVAGSLSLQVLMWGKNLHFFTWGMCAVKLHTTMWCCFMYSSFVMAFTLQTVLLKLLW